MHFARTLRAAGLPIGPGQVLEAIRAVRAVGIVDRRDFYWTRITSYNVCYTKLFRRHRPYRDARYAGKGMARHTVI